jgi:uncharacterized membrane protein
MDIRVQKLLEEIRSSYWFVPAVMTLSAIGLSVLTTIVDQQLQIPVNRNFGLVFGGGPQGARDLLTTVAGSMITVAGVTFSITIVAFSQASSQFGPRMLRNFMRDTGNQVVLGTFIATFIYCLLILRTVRSGTSPAFTPNVSVTVGLVLSLASLGVLIYFIHHTALSMQAPIVISELAGDLFSTIDRLFPERLGSGRQVREFTAPPDPQGEPDYVTSKSEGYVLALDTDRLMQIAADNGLVLGIEFQPGRFLVRGVKIVRVWPTKRLNKQIADKIRQTIVLGKRRTHTQDIEFAIEQLVEVAVRSLSPSINDPFTVISCIDWLGAALVRLVDREFPSAYRYDQAGDLRIILREPVSFDHLVEIAFNPIRRYAGESAGVRMRLLDVIYRTTSQAKHRQRLQVLVNQAAVVKRSIYEQLSEVEDRRRVEARYREIIKIAGIQS